MTIQQLKYVVALDQFRNFVLASNHCFVTQPTLTMQVKKLEDEIGYLLFDRSKVPLIPTKEGSSFIEKSRLVLSEFTELENLFKEKTHNISGHYHLGIIPTMAPYLLPIILPLVKKQFEDLDFTIHELQTSTIIERLKSGTIDFAILSTPLDEPNIIENFIGKERFLVFASKGHPLLDIKKITTDDLTYGDLYLLDEGHCFREQAIRICSKANNTKQHHPVFSTGSIETLKRFLKSSNGYTLIPEMAIEPNDEAFVKPFKKPEPVREISLVYHKSFAKKRLVEKLSKQLKKILDKALKSSTEAETVAWK